LQHKKPIPLLYIKALQCCFGNDDHSILVRDVDVDVDAVAVFKALILELFATVE